MSEGITTHVLDTSSEGPATGVDVTLQKLDSSGKAGAVGRGTTNDDGRVNEPLLSGDAIRTGTYQLLFEVGSYYRDGSTELSFLETVPVRFVVDDANEHYHVPLLLSPGSYTTYRGSRDADRDHGSSPRQERQNELTEIREYRKNTIFHSISGLDNGPTRLGIRRRIFTGFETLPPEYNRRLIIVPDESDRTAATDSNIT